MRSGSVFFPLACAVVALFATPSFSRTPVDPLTPGYHIDHDSIPVDPVPAPECLITAKVIRGNAQLEMPDFSACGSGTISRAITGEASFGAGSTIATGDASLIELALPEGSVVRLGPNSTLSVENLHCKAADEPFAFRLTSGSLWGKAQPATGGEIVMTVATEDGVVSVRGATFSIELIELDTVFQLKLIELYPPEYADMVKQIDSTTTIPTPFEGTATRVAVFEGSAGVEESTLNKASTVDGGKQLLCGLEGIPTHVEPIVKGKGFDGSGEYVGQGGSRHGY